MTTETTDQQTAAIAALYTALKATAASRAPTVREMAPADLAAYNRAAQQRRRDKVKASKAAGRPEASEAAVREALADAALLLLAVGGPGADAVMSALRKAFPGRPGVATTTRMRAVAGELKPRVLTTERLAAQAS